MFDMTLFFLCLLDENVLDTGAKQASDLTRMDRIEMGCHEQFLFTLFIAPCDSQSELWMS